MPDEVSQLHQFRLLRIKFGESRQGFVQGEQIIRGRFDKTRHFGQADSLAIATMSLALSSSSSVDEDLSHRFGRDTEKMFAIIEASVADQFQIGLVNQCRGIQSLPWLLLGHPRCRQFAQFVVDQRQQLRGGLSVAAVCCFEKLGDVGHRGILSRTLLQLGDCRLSFRGFLGMPQFCVQLLEWLQDQTSVLPPYAGFETFPFV